MSADAASRKGTTSSAAQGYALVALAYVTFGSIGVLVDFASAPESVLLALRFGTAALVLAALFARPRLVAEYRQPGVMRRLLLMGILDAASMLCFFVALRQTRYTIFVAGMSRIRVQRAAILGYLEPMTAPLYAYVLLGQRPAVAALAGGALILAAGRLIVVLGAGDRPGAEPTSPACCPATA